MVQTGTECSTSSILLLEWRTSTIPFPPSVAWSRPLRMAYSLLLLITHSMCWDLFSLLYFLTTLGYKVRPTLLNSHIRMIKASVLRFFSDNLFRDKSTLVANLLRPYVCRYAYLLFVFRFKLTVLLFMFRAFPLQCNESRYDDCWL